MGKSILYFSCPDRTTISGWCLQVTGRLTAQLTLFCPFIQNNCLFPSSTESGSKPYLQVASTQGFFTSQGDSWGGTMCQWNTGFEKKQSWSYTPSLRAWYWQRKRARKASVQYIYAILFTGTTHSFTKNSNFIHIFSK